MTLSEIIERLEAATGPDRRLDAEIACAVKFHNLRPAEPDDHKEHQRGSPPQAGDIWCPTGFLMADSYTRSIDDALTLVPEGLNWLIGKGRTRPDEPLYGAQVLDGAAVAGEGEADATPALAICIAALKARSV